MAGSLVAAEKGYRHVIRRSSARNSSSEASILDLPGFVRGFAVNRGLRSRTPWSVNTPREPGGVPALEPVARRGPSGQNRAEPIEVRSCRQQITKRERLVHSTVCQRSSIRFAATDPLSSNKSQARVHAT